MSQERFLARAAKIADLVLIAGGGASLLLAFYLFYRFGWSGQQRLASAAGVLVYYVLPVVLGCLLLAALRLRPNRRINLAIACLSVVVSVYGFEIFLKFSYPGAPGKPLLHFPHAATMERRQRVKAYINRHFGVDADIRAPFEVITQLRSEGIDAVPSIIPRLLLGEEKDGAKRSVLSVNGHEVLPLSGMSDRVTVLCNEPGEYVTYHSDQNGLHNPPGVWESGRVDIVAIGDSFTQGYCVPSDKNFVALIRKDHPATLNLGMAGEGPLQMLGAFEEYAARFNPKVVLWFYFEGNDLIDLQDERKSPLLMQYLNEGFKQDLLGRKADVDRGIAGYIERETVAEEKKRAAIKPDGRFDKWVYIAKLSSLRERLGLVYGSDAEQAQVLAEVTGEAVDLFRRVMTLAKERVSAHGGRLYFVYLPEWTRYKGNLGSAEKQREPVLQIVNDLGIPVIDVHPLFQSHKDPMSLFPFSAPGHYTEEGHRLVAEQVLKALASSK